MKRAVLRAWHMADRGAAACAKKLMRKQEAARRELAKRGKR